MRVAAQVVLTEEQRSELSAYARRRSVALRLVERANIILKAAEGKVPCKNQWNGGTAKRRPKLGGDAKAERRRGSPAAPGSIIASQE
jgi:hypothetical protein